MICSHRQVRGIQRGFALAGVLVATLSAQAQCELTEQSSVNSPDSSANDLFGSSIAADGSWLIVGAPRDDDAGTQNTSGSVYVYHRAGVTATYFQEVRPADGANGDGFGTAVAISGDLMAVGSPFRNTNANNPDTGTVYVFEFNGTEWVEVQKLFPFPGEQSPEANFGASVAIAGDRILAGSPSSDVIASNCGAVYSFEKVVGFWQPLQRLLSNDIAINDRFGTAMSADGDRVVIGAPNDDDGASNAGSVYVFEVPAGTWVQTAKCISTDPDASDLFGSSVALRGDRFVAGEPRDDQNGTRSGAAYVFRLESGVWTAFPKLIPPTASSADEAGTTVAIYEQFVLVGAPFDRDLTGGVDPDTDLGSATLFVNYNGDYEAQASLIATQGNQGSFLSTGLALGDGAAVVGAPNDTVGGQNDTGSIYLYPLSNLAVTADPADVTAAPGESAAFTISTESPPGSTVRWHYNGQPIFDSWPFAGTATETLQVLQTYASFEGEFFATLTDPCGIQVASQSAQLTINEGCAADVDHDGDVDFNDLNTLLFEYGLTCP